ncbi:extracellular solute-binding protein [Cohnella faecalis]|uniref:Maltodextrin-binding protein n=1 Tax=Cohnella faecalis TaxID=2315694 RepID=A0A398CBQ7_9BACL|nr:maltose ABC transporter substrate-binding protein [Cohnella faecalis]RIE00213.1 maltose ABC transporter substrate-binding protein [Cohnella faecalis]
MKKILSLVVVLSVIITLTACGEGTENKPDPDKEPSSTNSPSNEQPDSHSPEPNAHLTVWASKEELTYVNAMSVQFTQLHDIPVVVQEVGAGDVLNKLTTDGPAQIGADLVTLTHDHLGEAVAAGLLLPNDIWQDETKRNNQENVLQAASYGNILYGYPLSLETYVMFYNKKLVSTPPSTFDEVIDFAKTYNDPGKGKFSLMWEMENLYFNYFFLATTGGYIFGNKGVNYNDIGINSEGAIEGAAYYGSLRDKLLPLKSGDVTYDIKKGQFLDGSLAMNIDGPWLIRELRAQGNTFGAAPIPSINGKPSVSLSSVKAWYVNSYSKYPNAAKLFANFASSKESQLKNFQLTGAVPSNLDAMKDPAVQQDEFVSAIIKQIEFSQPMPSIPEMGSVWIPVNSAMSDIWNKGVDAKQALDKAAGQIKDSIAVGSSGGGSL